MTVLRKSSTGQDLKTSQKSSPSNDSMFVNDSSMFSDDSRFEKVSKFFANSRTFGDSQVFKKYRESVDLDLVRYLSVVRRHWLPAAGVFVITVGVSAFATTLLKPSYEGVGKLLFKNPNFSAVGNSIVTNIQEGGGDLRPLVSSQNPISTQMEIISSQPILQKAIDKLRLKNSQGKVLEVNELERSLKLQILGGADVLKITYKSNNAAQAAAVVNAIVDSYLENDILANRGEARAIRQAIANEIPVNRDAVTRAEEGLRIFKQKNNIINLAEESKSAVTTIGNLDAQIDSVRAELDREIAQTDRLREQADLNSEDGISASALSQSPAIKSILTDLQEVEKQLAVKRSQFKEGNPAIVDLEAKKANLKTLLQKQIVQINGNRSQPTNPELLQIGELRQTLIANYLASDVQRLGSIQKLTSLQKSKADYEQRVKILPQLEQQQRELERRIEVPQNTYQTLLKKVKELQLAENNDRVAARVINRASVPTEPLPSIKALILVMGGLSGAFLATVTIALLELRRKTKNRRAANSVAQPAKQIRSTGSKFDSRIDSRTITKL